MITTLEIHIVNHSHQSRRRPLLGVDFLESRNLLNAHLPHPATVHVAAHVKTEAAPVPPAPKAPHEISGTLTGIQSYTLNPNNANQGYDTYSATAPAKGGLVKYYGTDSYTSVQVSPSTFQDTYFNGFTVLSLAGGNDISISYAGKGPYPASDIGAFSATLKGEAIGITGALTGHAYSFTAKMTGDAATGDVTIKFTMKD
jgi:hypothetical protein